MTSSLTQALQSRQIAQMSQMSVPDQMLEATRDILAALAELPRPHPARQLDIDRAWVEARGLLADQPASIQSWAWETPSLGWFRVALLQGGDRARVFSALSIPHPQFDLPLFGAEVVEISGSVTVVALDWIPLFPDSRHLGQLARIREQFSHFPRGDELPRWAAEAFSPYALFSRPRGAVPESDILTAYCAYLGGYLALCAEAMPVGDADRTLAAQNKYCRTHFDNDPGANMLAKIFGTEWAQQYSEHFLFRTAGTSLPQQGSHVPPNMSGSPLRHTTATNHAKR